MIHNFGLADTVYYILHPLHFKAHVWPSVTCGHWVNTVNIGQHVKHVEYTLVGNMGNIGNMGHMVTITIDHGKIGEYDHDQQHR